MMCWQLIGPIIKRPSHPSCKAITNDHHHFGRGGAPLLERGSMTPVEHGVPCTMHHHCFVKNGGLEMVMGIFFNSRVGV